MDKHTALFKYVVKSVLFSVITVPPWSYAKHFVLCGYCKGKVNNIWHLNTANTGTFDFVLKERPNIGFSFVLA